MAYELPYLLFENLLDDNSTLAVTSEEAGFPIENILDGLDWTYWKATSIATQNIDIDLGSAGTKIDSLGCVGHNFGSIGESAGPAYDCYVKVYEDDNAGFTSPTQLVSKKMVYDEPFVLELSTTQTERYIRVEIASRGGDTLFAPPECAVMILGKKLEMPVGPEFSFDPDMQDVRSEAYVSYSGRLVSSAMKYSERRMNCEFKRLPEIFVYQYLLPFLEDYYGQMLPFFFVPDPGKSFTNPASAVKAYYLTAPDNPTIELPVYQDDIGYRNWTLRAQGVRQSVFRSY